VFIRGPFLQSAEVLRRKQVFQRITEQEEAEVAEKTVWRQTLLPLLPPVKKYLHGAKSVTSHKKHKKPRKTRDGDVELSISSCSCFSWLFSFGCGRRPRWVFRGEKTPIGESRTWSLLVLAQAEEYIPAIRVAPGGLSGLTLSGISGRMYADYLAVCQPFYERPSSVSMAY